MISRTFVRISCAVGILLLAGLSLRAQGPPPADTREARAASGTADVPSEAEASSEGSATVARRPDLIGNLAIFMLAIFVGFEVITKVPPTLHTPLMSGSNAISGITLVGALTIAGTSMWGLEPIVGFVAVVLATINVVGGFAVTNRMLSMFKRR